ncbi:BMP and activin membrane-bound inhibitor homolog isoform X2 [Liolophura sinensis]
MCKSSLGKCYSMLTYEGDITHSVHGCLDSVKTEDRNLCSGDRELMKRKKSADWPVLLCCKDDMCNYIDSLDINIVVNTKSNGSIQRGQKARPSSTSGNRHVIHTGKVEEKNSDKDVWFKAAVIAVPIAGGFILILLVLLAVRMLRTDTRRHRRLLQIRRERSLTRAQLYVSDHFCSKSEKKNSKHLYSSQNHHNNAVYKDVNIQLEKEKLYPEKTREKKPPSKPHNSVIVWGKTAKSDVATVV